MTRWFVGGSSDFTDFASRQAQCDEILCSIKTIAYVLVGFFSAVFAEHFFIWNEL